jgi:biopolymer transport protein ExbB/TolQ
MSRRGNAMPEAPLQFRKIDPEARLGLSCGPGTTPSDLTCLLATVLGSGAVYGSSYLLRDWTVGQEEGAEGLKIGMAIWEYLTAYGRIPIPITVLSIWCLAFLAIKALKIRTQRAALSVHFVPEDSGFVLTDATADAVIDAIDRAADQPMRFLFLARCRNVLRMMRNLGRVSDVDDAFASRADQDDLATDSGYTILRGFIWAIPVLGFIGTVIGLTQAMGQFGEALKAAGTDIEGITKELTKVLGGLDTAFVTTAEALIAVIIIQILQTLVRRADERLSDDLRIACSNAVVSRVRIRGGES